jgi:putative SOS response-associated peptidase YedK
MCYSALVNRSLKKTAARYRAKINVEAFVDLYAMRARNPLLKIPLGMDAGAVDIGGMAARSISKSIREFSANEDMRIRQALSDLEAEITELEARLHTKVTKTHQKALEAKLRKREKLLRREVTPKGETYRIYPYYFAPVIIESKSGRELLPMRYRLLPSNNVEVPPQYNVFNARRDSLRSARSWKPLFGSKHALFPFEKFYEWVEREGRKVELIFAPDGYAEMWAASLFSETKTRDGVIRSFAMVTDDPPPEVAAAGHDRCPVFLREGLIDEWLQPEATGLDRLDSLLDDKQPTYFSNAMAA